MYSNEAYVCHSCTSVVSKYSDIADMVFFFFHLDTSKLIATTKQSLVVKLAFPDKSTPFLSEVRIPYFYEKVNPGGLFREPVVIRKG